MSSVFRTITLAEFNLGIDISIPKMLGSFKINREAVWSDYSRTSIDCMSDSNGKVCGLSLSNRLECLSHNGYVIVNKIPEYKDWVRNKEYCIFANPNTNTFDDVSVQAVLAYPINPRMSSTDYNAVIDDQVSNKVYKGKTEAKKSLKDQLLVRLCYIIEDISTITDDYDIVQDSNSHMTLFPKVDKQPKCISVIYGGDEYAYSHDLVSNFKLHCMLLKARGYPDFEEHFDANVWKLACILSECSCYKSNCDMWQSILDYWETKQYQVIDIEQYCIPQLVHVMEEVASFITSDDYDFYFDMLDKFHSILIDLEDLNEESSD